MYRLRFPDNYIHPSYIESWLRTSVAQKELNDRKTGISESGLNMTQAKFKTLPVVIAPIAEQRVIADTLDELLAQVNNTKVRLDAIPAILKSFRQSVLATAVSGRLTENNRINDSDYAAQIQNEINSDKKLKKIPPLSSEEISLAKSMHGEVNWEHWNLMPLELLVEAKRGIPYGIVQTGEHCEGGVPTVRCGDVKPLEILKQQLKLVDNNIEEKYKRTSLIGGEVLLAIRGTVGNAAVASRDMQGFNISREVAMIPLRSSINPNFIALLLQSPTGYKCLAEKVRGVAQKGINLSDVKRFVTPLPSIEEQIEIVSRVEELFGFADKVEAQVNEAQTKVNNLTQSILAKAFRGELTAGWRADHSDLMSGKNSADALLKDIKVEREDFIRTIKEKPVKKLNSKTVATKNTQDTIVDKNLTPVESVIADGVAHKPQDIFDKLTPDLSMTEVFNEISKLLSANKIEEKTVDGITGFFIK
jgi:type I restriction enzyme S subunit